MADNQVIRRELVFWLDAPPRTAAGVLKYVAANWGAKTYFICAAPMKDDRRAMGWVDGDHGNAFLIILSEIDDVKLFFKEFINEHRDAIHIGNGFRGVVSRYFKKYVLSHKKAEAVIWSERPGVFENVVQKYIKVFGIQMLNKYYYYKYRNKIVAILPLGVLAVKAYQTYKWSKDIIFPLIYETSHKTSDIACLASNRNQSGPVRFLYVGQFTWRKGVDIIIRAFNDKKLKGNWCLHIVGKHGKYEKDIAELAKNNNISYLGVWPSDEVVRRISEYDVCLVPSRFDGWGFVTNEAFHAGRGVIVSDATGSMDLVKESGAGIVVEAGDLGALKHAVSYVIEHPEVVTLWNNKASEFSKKISVEMVGGYFIDVLNYTFSNGLQKRPVCPWIS